MAIHSIKKRIVLPFGASGGQDFIMGIFQPCLLLTNYCHQRPSLFLRWLL